MTWTKQLTMTVFPIGQGLFTQCDVKVGGETFRIVYDCGSDSKEQEKTESYLELLRGKKLDLLVISHFHWDHISYISKLLNITKGAHRVWIPYIAPKLRLLSAIYSSIEAEFEEYDLSDRRDAVALSLDPAGWFGAHGADEVEEVGGEGLEGGDGPPPPKMLLQLQEGDNLEEPGLPGVITLDPLRTWPGAFRTGSSIAAASSGLNASYEEDKEPTGTMPRNEGLINLITWVKTLDEDKIEALYQEIASLILVEARGKLKEYYLKAEEIPESDVMKLADLIRTRTDSGDLRKIYNGFHGDFNNTSLFLLAQVANLRDIPLYLSPDSYIFGDSPSPLDYPFAHWRSIYYRFLHLYDSDLVPLIFPSSQLWHNLSLSDRSDICEAWIHHAQEKEWHKAFPSILWCGDAQRSVLNEVVKDAENVFRQRMDSATWWQVSHHGAKTSYSKSFFNAIKPTFGFISCGHTNRHDHPNPEVVRETGARIVTELSQPLQFGVTWK